jgi:hypothetical protein
MPVWRIGEGLLFAARFVETFEDVEAIAIRCRFAGLNGRRLDSFTGARVVFEDRVSRTDEIVLDAQATPQQIRDNLAEVMHQLLIPLYERFAFFLLDIALVEEELGRMTRNRF